MLKSFVVNPPVVTLVAFSSHKEMEKAKTLGQALKTGKSIGTFYDGKLSTYIGLISGHTRRNNKKQVIGHYLGVTHSAKVISEISLIAMLTLSFQTPEGNIAHTVDLAERLIASRKLDGILYTSDTHDLHLIKGWPPYNERYGSPTEDD